MARVILLSTTPPDDCSEVHRAPLHALRRAAELDRFGIHSLTDDPAKAEVILFVESYGGGWHFERVRRHPLLRRYREKCFMFCSNPFVIAFIPGLYTGVERRWKSGRTVTGFYVGQSAHEFGTFIPPRHDLRYLYSFVGATQNAPVRRRLACLVHPRSIFQDTSADFARALHLQMRAAERRAYHRRYAEVTKESKFVLCPRGLSVSTVRVFETMQMGRVPVILSNSWIEPPGPAWEKFAIRIPEQKYAQLPQILEEREPEAVAMGGLARREWLEWYADDVAFHRAIECCLALKRRRRVPESLARWSVYPQYLRPFHFRRLARRWSRRVTEGPMRAFRFGLAGG